MFWTDLFTLLLSRLGGDHTIVLPILRALNKVYGPVAVVHFDAHMNTFAAYPGQLFEESRVTHGTFFHIAYEENLIRNNSIHAGIRSKVAESRSTTQRHFRLSFWLGSGRPRHRQDNRLPDHIHG